MEPADFETEPAAARCLQRAGSPEAAEGACQGGAGGPPRLVRALAFNADGRWLATRDSDGVLLLGSVEQEVPLRRCEGHGSQILSVRFDPACERVVSGSADETAKVWDRAIGRWLATLRPETLCAGLSRSAAAAHR